MTGITMPNAIVVPKAAISPGPLGPFVYVVEADIVARARQVRLVPRAGRRLDRAQGPAGGRPHRGRRRHPRPAGQCREAGARRRHRRGPTPGAAAGWAASRDLEILHRPAGLRLGPLDRHRAGGPGGDARAADLAVPADRAARSRGLGDLSRRHGREHRRHRRRAARAADQRRRAHDLHALDLDRLGHDEPHGHLRDRHQPRPERHQRQQPRAARACRCCPARSRRQGRGRAEALDLDPAGADHVVAGRALRHDLHQQLRAGERAR